MPVYHRWGALSTERQLELRQSLQHLRSSLQITMYNALHRDIDAEIAKKLNLVDPTDINMVAVIDDNFNKCARCQQLFFATDNHTCRDMSEGLPEETL